MGEPLDGMGKLVRCTAAGHGHMLTCFIVPTTCRVPECRLDRRKTQCISQRNKGGIITCTCDDARFLSFTE